MKWLWVPALLTLLANGALAEDREMQRGLQQIQEDRAAELDRRFDVRLNKLIDSSVIDVTAGPAGTSLEDNRENLIVGDQPRYLARHLAR